MRISIIGQPASGKSMLAEKISQKLNIPYLHLDRIYFEEGGHEALKKKDGAARNVYRERLKKSVEKFIAQDSWVSDGWYKRVQPAIAARADVILYLDIPLWRRLLSHAKRAASSGRHAELTVVDEFTFVWTMIERMFTHEPKIRAFMKEQGSKVLTLRSYTEIDKYLENLGGR